MVDSIMYYNINEDYINNNINNNTNNNNNKVKETEEINNNNDNDYINTEVVSLVG